MTTTTRLGYPVVDADNHYYEPYDCFTRHIDEKFREKALRAVHEGDGPGQAYLGDKRIDFVSNWVADAVRPPGALREVFLHEYDDSYTDVRQAIPQERAWDHPAWMQRDARLEKMDRQGLQAAILLGTLNLNSQYELEEDLDVSYANWVSFNKWLEDDWGYDYQNRIFAAPVIPLGDVDRSVAEVDRVLGRGARILGFKTGPTAGRSPGDAYYDAVWARAQEADVPVAFHVGDAGYNELVSAHWGQPPRSSVFEMSPLQMFLGFADRPIADTLAALVLGNVFGRFPALKVLSLENGHAWVRQFMRDVDHAAKMSRLGGHKIDGQPSEVFREHVYVAPFWEDDPKELVELIGADRVLFGSDWPHPEGVAEPIEFADSLGSLPNDAVRAIMRDNTAKLLKL